MKTSIFSMIIVATLCASPIVFGEIIYDETAIGEGSSWGTVISAFANGSNPEDSAYGGGYQSYYTTEAGAFTWYYELCACTNAELLLVNNNPCDAHAVAETVASDYRFSWHLPAETYLSGSGIGERPYLACEPNAVYYNDTAYLPPDEGVDACHYAYVEANVIPGSPEFAYANAEATAWCYMY